MNKMSDEWARYKKILEQGDKEVRKAMEAEVSTLFCPKFSSKCRVLTEWILLPIPP